MAEAEAFFRANGVDDNFQIIGVGGVEVKGMAPPSGKRLKRGEMVTTELTPSVDGYYAQICRTLVIGKASAEQRAAHSLWRESMEAGIAAVRDGVTAADIAKAENDVFRKYGMGQYTTSEYTRVRGHGMGLFADSKPHLLEDVTTPITAGMTLIVHPNTYHPVVGYMVLGDGVVVTKDGCEVVDATALFAALRTIADEIELGLLQKADSIAVAALDQVVPNGETDSGKLTGLVEKHARLAGAEEVYVTIAPDLSSDTRLIRISEPTALASRFAVRGSVAYKGNWARRTRTFAKGRPTTETDTWFAGVVRSLEGRKSIASQLAEKIRALAGVEIKGWMAESCTGSYPLAAIDSSHAPGKGTLIDGQYVVLTVELSVSGFPWIGSAPLIVGKPFF